MTKSLLLISTLVVAILSSCIASSVVHVRITVIAPRSTSPDAHIYVAGNHPEAGNWNPAGKELTRTNDSTWSGTLTLSKGIELEFKVTRGSWNTQAMYIEGEIPSNHRLVAVQDTEVVIRPVSWNDKRTNLQDGITGMLKYHRQLSGTGLKYSRDLIVWLPPGYDESTERYPVLYMHDGQNVFDPSTSFIGYDWHADEVADSLIRAGKMQKIIIVGISNSGDRMEEYADTDLGRAYAKFVVGRVKPFIDSLYRTRPEREHTAVMGSSMGGLISFLFVWWHPDVFSKAGCLSSVFDGRALNVLQMVRNDHGPRRPIRVYMDCGGYGGEGSLKPGMDEMYALLTSKGYQPGVDVERFFDPAAEHNERAWAARLWRPMEFLFPPTPATK